MGGRASASAAIKTRSRKIPYLVVFIKNSHSGTQQKCCTSACTHASSENKTCSPQIVFTFLSAWDCQGHAEQTGPRRRAWQVRRPIQYNCRNSSRGMEVVFRSSQQQQQYSRSVATRNVSVMQTFFFFYYSFLHSEVLGHNQGSWVEELLPEPRFPDFSPHHFITVQQPKCWWPVCPAAIRQNGVSLWGKWTPVTPQDEER